MEQELIAWNREVSGCTDPELMSRLQHLTRADRKLVARLIVYLGEVDARGLFREHAYPSMHEFLVGALHMSDAEAYLRRHAARLARQYPVIITLLATGAVNLSTLRLMSKLLTPENHLALLERLRGKTKRQVELLVAELDPKPDVLAQMRKLPQRVMPMTVASSAVRAPVRVRRTETADDERLAAAARAQLHAAGAQLFTADRPASAVEECGADHARNTPPNGTNILGASATTQADTAEAASANSPKTSVSSNATGAFVLEAPREKPGALIPLGPGRYKLQLPADQVLHDKLEQLKHLLRHQVPNGDLTKIVERAVELLLTKTLKQRFAQTSTLKSRSERPHEAASEEDAADGATPQPSAETIVGASTTSASKRQHAQRSRYIPRALRRAVYVRDAGQCTFVSSNGRRCAERGTLELHHVVAFARGGATTLENLRLVCRCHNGYLAERDFGAEHMRLKRASSLPEMPGRRANLDPLLAEANVPRAVRAEPNRGER